MKFTGTTYRPPMEYDSMLLQVTTGCHHNKCRFCGMYKDVRFSFSGMDEIEEDIREARGIYKNAERIFLVNGDAFVLKADQLCEIAERLNEVFPECQRISMYSSVSNIKTKSDHELKRLRSLKINDLYIGIESGLDDVVKFMGKGHTKEEALSEIERLDKAGIRHNSMFVMGSAGKKRAIESGLAAAEFINRTRPGLVWCGTLSVLENADLFDDVKNKTFVKATELEILEEEKTIIENIDIENLPFWGNHPTNLVPLFGYLPGDKEAMINAIDRFIERSGEDFLMQSFDRNGV